MRTNFENNALKLTKNEFKLLKNVLNFAVFYSRTLIFH